jgi:transcriptional regulator with XRE-family HTH domain
VTDIAAELRLWRRRMGWTQAEAAAMLRVSYQSYRRWEEGRAPEQPGLILLAICHLEQHPEQPP